MAIGHALGRLTVAERPTRVCFHSLTKIVERFPESDVVEFITALNQLHQYHGIAAEMETAARDRHDERQATVSYTIDVTGVYDMPLAVDRLVRRDDVDAVVVLAAVVTGDTDHDQVVTRASSHTLSQISVDRDTPVGFGVTGPGMSGAEASERTEYGVTASMRLDLHEQVPAISQ